MQTRVPKILDDLIEKNRALGQRTVDRIRELRDEIREGKEIRELAPGAPDVDDWSEAILARPGEGWLSTDWFFAETLVYRRVIEACRWWETGEDPFVEHKREELASEGVWERFERGLNEAPDVHKQPEERLSRQLLACLWGNRVDLSYPASLAQGHTWRSDDLLSDERAFVMKKLTPTRGRYDVIADNTDTELLADLALIDSLLQLGASVVTLHVKVHPTFVSDATAHDVHETIRAMSAHGGESSNAATRLRESFDAGRLRLAPDLFWNGPRFGWELPRRLRRLLTGSTLTLIKGDANYRRVVGDAMWPAHASLKPIAEAWPCAIALLRTLKSDTLVGLEQGVAERLDASSPGWRVDGKRGVIQASDGAA
ncbi:MAG: ARMT1-like domain-containing protein [Polyangiaceae bacterium]